MAREEARIERKDGHVYYIDENGKTYIVYLLAQDNSEPHYCTAVVAGYTNGKRTCINFYIPGIDDEVLLACCKEYVHAI